MMTSRAFESWVVATSTASVGLPLQIIIASIVLIMWPHPFAYASFRVHVGIPALTCSVNKPPGSVPLPGPRWHRDRWQKGREPRIWELVRVAAGASVKATSDRRGDGKWGDSRTGTYWIGRTCTRTCGRCPPRERGSSAFWTLAGWRVIEIALRDSLQPIRPWRNFNVAPRITSHCSRNRQLPSSFSLDSELPRDVDPRNLSYRETHLIL